MFSLDYNLEFWLQDRMVIPTINDIKLLDLERFKTVN